MDPYVYTNMAEKVRSLEAKIQQLEKAYKSTATFEVKKSQYHFGTAHYLIDLTRDLKNDILYKPLSNYYDSKVLSQMYDRICILEFELNKVLLPKRQEQIMERGLRDEIVPLVCDVEKLPFRIYNNCAYDSPFKRYKVKYNSTKCIPPETFFEPLSMYTNVTENKTSTDSLEEIMYYDNLSSYSSSSSVITISNYYEPSQSNKTVHSRNVKNVPIHIRKSKPMFKNKYIKNRPIKPKKEKYSSYSIKRIPIDVRKSKSKHTFKHEKPRVAPENKNRKVRALNISVKKQRKPKRQLRKNVKRHKSQRRRPPPKLRISRSESPKIKVYSSNFSPKKQGSEIYLIRKPKEYPKDNDNNSNKEKYFTSRLNRKNTPSVRKGVKKVKPLKRNRSPPKTIRNSNYTDGRPPRNNSLKFEKSNYKNGKNKSETSLESQYIKSKWKQSPHRKRSKFQTNKGHGNHSLVVANSSVGLNTPFLENRPHKYNYVLGFNNNEFSSSSETFNSSSFESNMGLRRLSSDDILFINNNYEVIESFYDVDTDSDEQELQFSPASKEHKERGFSKPPTTVYTIINKNHQVNPRGITLNDDAIASINNGVSPLYSRQQLNYENLGHQQNTFKNERSTSSRNDDFVNMYNQFQENEIISSNNHKYASIHEYKEDSKTVLKNPFGGGTNTNSVYLSTIPINQFDLPNKSENNKTQQPTNNSQQVNTNVPETSTKNNDEILDFNQTNLLVKNQSPVLSTSMKPNSKLRSSINTVSSRNVTKQNSLITYNVQVEDTKNPSGSKGRLKKILSVGSLSRILQSTKKSKEGSTHNLTNNHPLNGKRDSKKLQRESKLSNTSKTNKRSLSSPKVKSDNSKTRLSKDVSKNIKSEKRKKSRITENKKSGTRVKPIKSSLSFKNIFRRSGKTKKKGLSPERSQKVRNNEQSIESQSFSDKTSGEIENIYGPRSISKLLQHLDRKGSVSTMVQKDVQNDSSKQNFRRARINHKQCPSSNQDYNKLNYSLHFAKSKRRNVEMCSIPSSLSLADIMPSKCKTIMSMEEIFLSEHKFNGMELHGKVHEIFVRPNNAINKVSGKYINLPHSNSVKIKQNKNPQDNCRCIGTGHKNNLNFHKSFPIFDSGQVSDSSYPVDWKKIAHEVKEYY